MKYLADTTFLIDLVNGNNKAIELAKELDEINEFVGLSVISAEEYLRGVYYLYWNNEKLLKKKIADAKRDLSAFEIMPITYDIAIKAAEIEVNLIKNGEMLSLADILIASTAIYYDLILITKNVKHFQKIQKLKIRSY